MPVNERNMYAMYGWGSRVVGSQRPGHRLVLRKTGVCLSIAKTAHEESVFHADLCLLGEQWRESEMILRPGGCALGGRDGRAGLALSQHWAADT